MTHTPKLSDMQLILLATACQRADGSLLPPPDNIGAQGTRIRKAVAALIKRALATEIAIDDPTRQWRQDGERSIGVVITDAGRAIIAAEEAEPQMVAPGELPAAAPQEPTPQKPASKIAMVANMLRRDSGATLAELVAATGWLPHTTRAALTGLRKKGHAIAKERRGDATCYRIGGSA